LLLEAPSSLPELVNTVKVNKGFMIVKKFFVLTGFFFIASFSYAQQTQIKYLSGIDKDNTVSWDFFCTKGRNSGVWSKIPVPSCWELQGFGTYHYGWEENFKENETGLYKYAFQSDPSWKNKTVRLVFEGSMTDTEVKINGKLAGPIHQGAFYRFKYDVTSLLKENNLLEVKVDKISADTSVNRAERMSDFWVFGGIFRPVYLEILPKQFIDWTAVDAKADGTFQMEVYLSGIKDATQIEAQIKTLDGRPVGEPFVTTLDKNHLKMTIHTKIENPEVWTPELPKLYQVDIRLKNVKGMIHTVTEKFGFRTVEFREGLGFFVNGQRIIFKGTNHHSSWPTSGRTTTKSMSIQDVNLIKEMNMNSVRMSHYPPDAHFLDACDSIGLFVLDELTGWQKKYDTPVGRKLLKEMMMKDVNHPSIIIWDNGNEGGNNHDLVDDFAKYDPQLRKVIHPWNVFQGTDTQHYKGYNCCVGSLYQGNNVFFPTEFLHGLYDGGNGAGLDDHWKLMMSNPLSAGCFLWVFADEGIVRHDMDDKMDIKGNRAPDGILGPYREKEGSFFTVKEIWSPVQIKNESPMNYFDGSFTVENKYFYTNLDQVQFTWKLVKLAAPSDEKTEGKLISSGAFTGPAIAPQQSGKLTIPVGASSSTADVFYLTATDAFKREINTWSWPLKSPQQINSDLLASTGTGKVVSDESASTIVLKAQGVEVSIDKQTGMISHVKNSASDISLSGGPVLAMGSAQFSSLKAYANGNNYVIEVSHQGDLKKLKYTMLSNGILKIEYSYSLYKWSAPNAYDYLGVNFNYPEEKITGVKYLGAGPYRAWKNRMKGGTLGVWQKPYNNTVTGESWDYPEFKGYFKDFKWVVIENKESPFRVFTETDNLFLRLYTPEKPKGAQNDFTSPPFPEGDISFLHAIPPIGTKFDGPENHGPQGQKNKIGTEWISGVLYFDFVMH
jgi:hypothetical protein